MSEDKAKLDTSIITNLLKNKQSIILVGAFLVILTIYILQSLFEKNFKETKEVFFVVIGFFGFISILAFFLLIFFEKNGVKKYKEENGNLKLEIENLKSEIKKIESVKNEEIAEIKKNKYSFNEKKKEYDNLIKDILKLFEELSNAEQTYYFDQHAIIKMVIKEIENIRKEKTKEYSYPGEFIVISEHAMDVVNQYVYFDLMLKIYENGFDKMTKKYWLKIQTSIMGYSSGKYESIMKHFVDQFFPIKDDDDKENNDNSKWYENEKKTILYCQSALDEAGNRIYKRAKLKIKRKNEIIATLELKIKMVTEQKINIKKLWEGIVL